MIPKIYTFLFALLFTFNLSAQKEIEAMMNDAKAYNAAYLSQDYDTCLKYTIKSVVEMAGGEEEMKKVMKEYAATLKSMKMSTISLSPNEPEEIDTAGDDLHAILPQTAIVMIGENKVKRTVYYLASSSDLGKSWTFLDLEPYDLESLKMFVPSFTGELELPEPDAGELVEK